MASSSVKHGQENEVIIGTDNSSVLGCVKDKKGDDGKITEESVEDEAIDWEEGGVEDEDDRVELGLAGRIWTNRNINANAFMATIKNIWQPKHGLDISATGNNVFVFQFYHWKDKQRVLEGQPCHFNRHAIILDEIDGAIKPSNMELYAFPMWVRVYNLPFKGRSNTTNVEAIGNKIGSFVKMDATGSVGIDKSIRLRIMVDVRKPLFQKVKIKMRGGEEEFFDVKYERLPLFCHNCGHLAHGLKDCDDWREEDETQLRFGSWLKASPWKISRSEDRSQGVYGKEIYKQLNDDLSHERSSQMFNYRQD